MKSQHSGNSSPIQQLHRRKRRERGDTWCNLKLLSKITGEKEETPTLTNLWINLSGRLCFRADPGARKLFHLLQPRHRQELGKGRHDKGGTPSSGAGSAWASGKPTGLHIPWLWGGKLPAPVEIPPLTRGCGWCCLQARWCPWWIWGEKSKWTPKSLRVCTGTCVYEARFLLLAKASTAHSPACLFQPGWVREIFPPPLPLHLTQKMFENPRFLPSPASPPLGNGRLKEKQTKASLCSGELTGRGASTPPLLPLLPSRGSSLPIVYSSSRHVKGFLGVVFSSKQGLGLIERLLILIMWIVVRAWVLCCACGLLCSLLCVDGRGGYKAGGKGTAGIFLSC